MPQLSTPTANAPFASSSMSAPPNEPIGQAPRFGASTSDKLGWFQRARSEANSYLASQPPYSDIEPALKIIQGNEEALRSTTRNRVRVNRLKRQIREVVAALSQIRAQGWTFRTDNRTWDDQCGKLTKLIAGWFNETKAPRRIRQALQWACVGGTGYLSPRWNPSYHSAIRGDIELDVLGPRDVLPVQLPKSGDLQSAYALILRSEIGIEDARNRYPDLAGEIQPDALPRSTQAGAAIRRMARIIAPAMRMFGAERGGDASPASANTVSIHQCYIRDSSINATDAEIPMGPPGTSWFYRVPYLGQLISSGVRDEHGVRFGGRLDIQMKLRPATAVEARLYPTRRLQVWIGDESPVLAYDGPSPYWFAKAPLVRITVDDWPWLQLGFSLTHDGRSLQQAHTSILRSVVQAVMCRLDPHLTYNSEAVTETAMKAMDLRQPAGRLATSGLIQDNAIKPTLPAEYYSIQEGLVKETLLYLDNQMDYLTASRDLTAMAKAKQIPSSDSIEKLMEMAGPVTRDISEGMRQSLMELGGMVGALIMQWYTLPRRLKILGPDGITEQDYDFDPQNMIPSHFPWESPTAPSAYSLFQRGLSHLDNFIFHITPGSLHEITQTSKQLMLLQLFKLGLPIDPWTILEAFSVPNIGPPPEGTTNVIERWADWNYLKAGIAAKVAGAMPQRPEQKGPGRPATNHAPAHIESKDGGTRSTVSTS